MSVIRGTLGNDVILKGTVDPDVIYGFSGDDEVEGDDGDDVIYGDLGNETLRGDLGNDYLFGNQGDDCLEGGEGNDIIIAGRDNDTLKGNAGSDYLLGNLGNDSLEGSLDDTLSGEENEDTFFWSESFNNFALERATVITDFGQGNDVLQWLNGAQLFSQGSQIDLANLGTNTSLFKISQGTGFYANDAIIQDNKTQELIAILKNIKVITQVESVNQAPIAVADVFTTSSVINGTTDADLISVSSPGLFNQQTIPVSTLLANDQDPDGNAIRLTQVSNPVNGTAVLSGSNVLFTPTVPSGNGSFNYTISDDTLTAVAPVSVTIKAIQQINGLAGNDTLIGGIGEDSLNGGDDNDSLLSGGGNDVLFGESGDDNLDGVEGDDSLNGGEGNDNLNGGDGNDLISGENGDDFLLGGLGNNTLDGGAGNDVLEGDLGSDSLVGAIGNDLLLGDLGQDTLEGGDGNDFIQGGAGTLGSLGDVGDLIFGQLGDDTLLGDYGDDTLFGGGGNDFIQGGIGDISLTGSGNDSLFGEDGDDTLFGDDGRDFLTGGLGNDILKGGAGNDSIVYNSSLEGGINEIMEDFLVGSDQILLTASAFGFGNTGILPLNNYGEGTNLLAVETSLTSSPAILAIDNGSGTLNLVYDSNGSTSGGQIPLVSLPGVGLLSFDQNSILLF